MTTFYFYLLANNLAWRGPVTPAYISLHPNKRFLFKQLQTDAE